MASYLTYSDLPVVIQDKIEKWGFPLTPTATRDAEIAKHEIRIQSLVNTWLCRRFSGAVPFTATTLPNVVKYAIALPLLIESMAGNQQKIGDSYVNQANEARELLKMLANGDIDLYSDNDDAVLSAYTSDYGIANDTDPDLDEEQYRVFPRPAGERPSSMDYNIDSSDDYD